MTKLFNDICLCQTHQEQSAGLAFSPVLVTWQAWH